MRVRIHRGFEVGPNFEMELDLHGIIRANGTKVRRYAGVPALRAEITRIARISEPDPLYFDLMVDSQEKYAGAVHSLHGLKDVRFPQEIIYLRERSIDSVTKRLAILIWG